MSHKVTLKDLQIRLRRLRRLKQIAEDDVTDAEYVYGGLCTDEEELLEKIKKLKSKCPIK